MNSALFTTLSWISDSKNNFVYMEYNGDFAILTIAFGERCNDMFDVKKTGEKIAVLRKEKRMTQEELAEKMDVSS